MSFEERPKWAPLELKCRYICVTTFRLWRHKSKLCGALRSCLSIIYYVHTRIYVCVPVCLCMYVPLVQLNVRLDLFVCVCMFVCTRARTNELVFLSRRVKFASLNGSTDCRFSVTSSGSDS